MVKKYRDIITGSVLLIFGAILFTATLSIKSMVEKVAIGPEFMPRVGAALLAILGFMILLEGLKSAKSYVHEEKSAEEIALQQQGTKRVLLSIALLVLYSATLNYIGFIIGTSLYIFLQTLTLAPADRRKPILYIIIAVVSSAVIYVTFVYGFRLMLPSGRLWG